MPRAKTKTRTTFPPKLADVEKVLGPAREWAGRCYEIATALVAHGFVEGVAVYGHWIGKVEPRSYFGLLKRGAPFIQHGWVQVQGDPNLILDPTRWAFTDEDPFLYFGPNNGEYDEGGNTWRKVLRGACPPFDPDERIHIFTKRRIASEAWTHVEKLLGADYLIRLGDHAVGSLTDAQLSWLANAPYDDLQPFVREIYAAIVACGQRALIPIDNYRRAERG
jgi:hypothetical protein